MHSKNKQNKCEFDDNRQRRRAQHAIYTRIPVYMRGGKYNSTSLERIKRLVLECEAKSGYQLLNEDENI